jgi:hypothetical protein
MSTSQVIPAAPQPDFRAIVERLQQVRQMVSDVENLVLESLDRPTNNPPYGQCCVWCGEDVPRVFLEEKMLLVCETCANVYPGAD